MELEIAMRACQHQFPDKTLCISYGKVSYRQISTIADCTKMHANGIGEIEIPTAGDVIRFTEAWQV